MSNSNVVECIVSVNALMVYQDEILLQRVVKKGNTLWLPGGKVEWEESFDEALKREILEETGISSDCYSYQRVAILHDRPQVTCKHIYILDLKKRPDNFSFDGKEISECSWFKISEIPQEIEAYRNSWVYYVLRDYSNGIFSDWKKLYTIE